MALEIAVGRVLVTGGTGVVGTVLVPRLAALSQDLVVIARNGVETSGLGHGRFIRQDVCVPFDLDPNFELIVHAATPASAVLNSTDPSAMLEIIISGTKNVISFARQHRRPPTVLFLSSGAVYGEMPPHESHIAEDCMRSSSSLSARSAYAEGKRVSELLLTIADSEGACRSLVARLFAFSGPHVPRDRHFAIGNFVRDAVAKQCITVRGDGTTIRSYLDEVDLADWLLAVIQHGEPGFAHHIGSERAVSIKELAYLTAERYSILTNERCRVEILNTKSHLDGVSRYVPSTATTRSRLGVAERRSLEYSLDSMIEDELKSI